MGPFLFIWMVCWFFSPLARTPLLFYQVLSINQRFSPDKMLFRNPPQGWYYWHQICLYFVFEPPNIQTKDSVLQLGLTNSSVFSSRSPQVKKNFLHLRYPESQAILYNRMKVLIFFRFNSSKNCFVLPQAA